MNAGGVAIPTERQVQRAIPTLARADRLRFLCGKFDLPEKFTDCWLWNAPASTGRYGMFRLAGSKYLPHRVMYALCWGEFDPSLCVCHRCDTPRCVNPNHLFLGSHDDNMADKSRKGRCNSVGLKGERQNGAKLKPADVLAIREDRRMQREIAEAYGVNQSTISFIKARKLWAHL